MVFLLSSLTEVVTHTPEYSPGTLTDFGRERLCNFFFLVANFQEFGSFKHIPSIPLSIVGPRAVFKDVMLYSD
jgi:hypothetical protein